MIRVTIEVEDAGDELRVVAEDFYASAAATSDTTTLNSLVRRAHEQADKVLLVKRNPEWVS